MNALAVGHILARCHGDHVTKPHTQILAYHLVHPDLGVIACIILKHNADRLPALFALQHDSVPTEKLELLHLIRGERHNGVVVIRAIVDDEAVG